MLMFFFWDQPKNIHFTNVSGIFSIWLYCKVNPRPGTNSHLPWAHGLKLQGNPLIFHGNQTRNMLKTSADPSWWKSWWFHPINAKTWPRLDSCIWLHWVQRLSPSICHPPRNQEKNLENGNMSPTSTNQLQIPAGLSPFPHGICYLLWTLAPRPQFWEG